MSAKRRRESSRPDADSQTTFGSVSSANNASSTLHSGFKPTFKVLLSLICFAALFLRTINVLQTIETPTAIRLLGDARGYHEWAVRIAEGDWYGKETFYQAPLYPYVLAVQIKFLGSGYTALRLFQALLGCLSVAAIGIAGRNFFRPSVGLIAASLYAVYPAAIYFDGIIQKTSLASFLLCLLLAAISVLYQRLIDESMVNENKRVRLMIPSGLIGIVLALLMLTRENSILWVPLLPLWIGLTKTLSLRDRGKLAGSYLFGLALILFPVAARNASLGGEWSPTTFQAGPNFYIGNHQASNGLYRPLVQGHETPMYERADAQRLAEDAMGRALTSREVSKFWFGEAWKEISQSPSSWIELMAIKSLMVINRFEVPDVECFYIYREDSLPLQIFGYVWHFGILFPLAVWGLTIRTTQRQPPWILHGLLLIMVAAIVMFFILGRYRQPLVPIGVLFASLGILDIANRIRDQNWTSIRIPLGGFITSLIFCNLPVHDESMLRASSYMNMGIAAGQAGNLGVSIPALYRAIQSHPEMVEAYVNLGKAMEMSNRPEDAIQCYEAALELEPNLIMVDAALGQVHAQLGNRQRASYHFQRAVELDPTDVRSRQALSELTTNE